jgi:hypothetical protein
MLSKTEIALKIDQKHSEYFEIFRSVKQETLLAPISLISSQMTSVQALTLKSVNLQNF